MRKTAKMSIVAGAVGLGMALSVSPASAASSDCPSANFCVWKDASYSGIWFGSVRNTPDWSYEPFTNMQNEDSSSWNRTTLGTAVIYNNTNYSSRTVCVSQGTSIAHHYSNGDKGQSHRFPGSCPSV